MEPYSYQIIPWDSKALALKTSELFVDENISVRDFQRGLKDFEAFNEAEGTQLATCRVPAPFFEFKKFLSSHEFRFVEASQILSRSLSTLHFKEPTSRIYLEVAKERDLEFISETACKDFNFGRFHEDPLIPAERSSLRYKYWIEGLHEDATKELYVLKDSSGVAMGFHAQVYEAQQSYLLLTGLSPKYSMFSLEAWQLILWSLKGRGCREVKTRVSVANVAVCNLYSSLGFKILRTDLDYHKYYSHRQN